MLHEVGRMSITEFGARLLLYLLQVVVVAKDKGKAVNTSHSVARFYYTDIPHSQPIEEESKPNFSLQKHFITLSQKRYSTTSKDTATNKETLFFLHSQIHAWVTRDHVSLAEQSIQETCFSEPQYFVLQSTFHSIQCTFTNIVHMNRMFTNMV